MISQFLKDEGQNIRNSWIAFFVRSKHMTILGLVGILLGGLYSISSMPIESEPEVKIPIGTVAVAYPGASPADVEKLVTDELETALTNLDDVKKITSNSSDGFSFIVVEFEADADLDDSIRALRDEVDTARSDLPDDALDPVVEQIRAGDRPIITFTVVGNTPFEELKMYVDDLEDRIEGVAGVSKVDVLGLPEKQVQVLVNQSQLEGYQLSISAVTQAIRANHIDVPVGSLRTDDYYYQASLKGQLQSAEDVASITVGSQGNQNVYLRDIAEVREVFAPPSSETELYENEETRTAVTLQVYKKVGSDLVAMADNVHALVDAYTIDELPAHISVITTDDESDRIREDLSNLLRNAFQTIVIIGLTLFLALGTREALATAFSIPLLYLTAFIGLAMIGETFNFLTFFALILSLGVVVDTSIVIMEGIHENINDHGMTTQEAALASLAAFRAPLTAGTLTTVAAFVPLGLMTGIMGEYVKHIPYTVNMTLMASLFVALMILPATAAWILRKNGHAKKEPVLTPVFARIREWYGSRIHRILHSQKRRRGWMLSMVGLFFLSIVLLAIGVIKFQLFSAVDIDFFNVTIAAPEGTALERTREIAKDVEEDIKALPELKRMVSVYGNGAPNKANITVKLVAVDDRDRTSYQIAAELRKKLRRVTEADVFVEEQGAGPPSGADIEMRLVGDDIRSLEEYAAVVQAVMEEVPGTEDVQNDLELSPGEYHVRIKRDRLEYFGVSAQQVGSILRTAVFGDDSVKINRNGDEIPIVVQVDFRLEDCKNDPLTKLIEAKDAAAVCRSNPRDVSQITSLLVPTIRGQVPMSELVDIELTSAVTTIRHYDADRVVSVKASVAEGYVLAEVLTPLMKKLDELEKPEGISFQTGGENEDTLESMRSLARASILAVLLIFVILVYQFSSFKQVFIIFCTMPLAFMGVLYGLAVIRLPLSFPGMIGLVALLGVVVNDAIVLMDKMNLNRNQGMQLVEAVEAACRQRLQPVIMTTLTTATGVAPLIFSGETFRDLAIVLALGITVATVFTLVVIPVLYIALESGELRPLSWPGRTVRFVARIGRVIFTRLSKFWKKATPKLFNEEEIEKYHN